MSDEADTTAEVTQPVKKVFGAKNLSKGSIVFACIWVAVLTVLKGMKKIELDQSEIIGSAAAIVMFWSPTYFSVYMDKHYAAKGGIA
jgi:hypothetical protein